MAKVSKKQVRYRLTLIKITEDNAKKAQNVSPELGR
jgi:hypothetical protein